MIETATLPWTDDENVIECQKCKSGARYFIGKECGFCKVIELQVAVQLIRKGKA